MLKRRNGRLRPYNVEIPLCAVLPDVFAQIEGALDAAHEDKLREARRAWARLTVVEAASATGKFLARPAGVAVRVAADLAIGRNAFSERVADVFLDWVGARSTRRWARSRASSTRAGNSSTSNGVPADRPGVQPADERVVRGVTASEEPKVTVPRVVDQQENEARRRLTEAGLRVTETIQAPSDHAAGTVFRTEPSAGVLVSKESGVRLWVSSGRVSTPAVKGTPKRKPSGPD